jgi:hypothetical protein
MESEPISVEPERVSETPVTAKVKKARSPAQLEVLFRARLKAAESIQKRVATKKASIVEVVPEAVTEKVIEKIPEPKIDEVPIVSKPPDDVVRAIVVPVPKKFKFSAEHGGYVLI